MKPFTPCSSDLVWDAKGRSLLWGGVRVATFDRGFADLAQWIADTLHVMGRVQQHFGGQTRQEVFERAKAKSAARPITRLRKTRKTTKKSGRAA